MRIARIGNMYQPVPATEYGGTQRSMAQMTAFQAAICAHEITLYAPADSTIIAFAADIAEKLGLGFRAEGDSLFIQNRDGRTGSIRLRHTGHAAIGYSDPDEAKRNTELVESLIRDERDATYDIIHCHHRAITYDALIPAGLGFKTLTHQHTGSLERAYADHRFPLIFISHSQADSLRRKYNAQAAGVVYHGLDSFTHAVTARHAGYVAWIGRFLENKGAHRAIAIARAAGVPLVLAGTIYDKNPASRAYFDAEVAPRCTHIDPGFLDRAAAMEPEAIDTLLRTLGTPEGAPAIIYAGAANEVQKQTLYGNALATLFPISWAEPFGRVMIESMACGTPVIGNVRIGETDCGSVREVIRHGVTGFAIDASDESDSVAQAVTAIQQARLLDRQRIRQVFEQDWSSERVARQLDALYSSHLQSLSSSSSLTLKP